MSGQSLRYTKSSGRPHRYSDAVGTITHQARLVSTEHLLFTLVGSSACTVPLLVLAH
jgi:hypothetical protein